MNEDAGRELAVFTQALGLPPQERAAFLEQACGADEHLRRKIEALLNAQARLSDFLEEPASAAILETSSNGPSLSPKNDMGKGLAEKWPGFHPRPKKRKGRNAN